MSQYAVIVEFYGVPRARAGRPEIDVLAATVAEALAAVADRCPALKGLFQSDGRLAPQYLVSVEGEHFVTDLAEPLRPGTRLLLLSADAGG
jgi:molybdopterin converting factor small subunit